jgi:hypothetical protein
VYVGTGNAQLWVQKFRGAQNVDNLYTCSILAVDLNTGQLNMFVRGVRPGQSNRPGDPNRRPARATASRPGIR